MEKIWIKDEIVDMLKTNPKAVTRGIVAIYQKQTKDEKVTLSTNHHNGIGFNAVDAKILSSFAEQILNGHSLTTKQFEIAKKRIIKYSVQLAKIANKDI